MFSQTVDGERQLMSAIMVQLLSAAIVDEETVNVVQSTQ